MNSEINSIYVALDLLQRNVGWMSWNLFLGLVPLGLTFWLFHQPRSHWFRWSILGLIGITFVLGVQRYNWGHVNRVARSVHDAYFQGNSAYLFGAIAVTFVLMILDIFLIHRQQARSVLWWFGFLAFVSFLPNAPYVLTDIIHLIEDIRKGYSVWIVSLALIPQYLTFMIIGFEAYVLSLIYFGNYLRRQGWGSLVFPLELVIHALNAIGIYLGRFERFNSWHILTQPDELVMSVVNDLTAKRPVLVMFVTFIVITVLYWLTKQLTLGIFELRRDRTPKVDPSEPDSPTMQS